MTEKSSLLVFKRFHASRIWLSISAVVLLLLWLETRNQSSSSYNLFLNGDSQSLGAEVWIDGTRLGEMGRSGGEGLGGAVFYGHVENGQHHIEIRKAGFKPFVSSLDMIGEDYLSVDLKPESN